jgi:hypothetical protein
MYVGWTIMALYVNINAGVGKPLWDITLGEFSVWFKVRDLDRAQGSKQLMKTRELSVLPSFILPCRPAFVYPFSYFTSGYSARQ